LSTGDEHNKSSFSAVLMGYIAPHQLLRPFTFLCDIRNTAAPEIKHFHQTI